MMLSGAAVEKIKFKTVCDACGSLGIKIAHAESAPDITPVECARCGALRGTLGALRELARSGISQLYEF
jgi:hypothetical protein